MNVCHLLTRAAISGGDRVAVMFGSRDISYSDLSDRVARLAAGLRRFGLGRGDRVAVLLHNSPAYLEVVFAVFRLGAVAVPINVKLHPREVVTILRDSGAALLVTEPALMAAIEAETGRLEPGVLLEVQAAPVIRNRERMEAVAAEPVEAGTRGHPTLEELIDSSTPDATVQEVAENDLAWLFYTSGTTGRPKGAMLTHRNLLDMTMSMLADLCGLAAGDVVLHAAPLSHGAGLYCLPSVGRGCTNVIYDGQSFDPQAVWRLIQSERVSVVSFLVPTQIKRLVDAGPPSGGVPRSLRRIVWGGAPLYLEDARRARGVLGDVLVGLYGQGEAPMTITGLTPQSLAEELESGGQMLSVGQPRTCVEVRVVDGQGRPAEVGEVGEIVVRGGVVMRGYWQDPEATAEALRDGWLHTGDLGYVDAGGRYFLVDRKKDLIISGGSNIYPREVEEALLEHPAVREALVFGVPNPEWGESVVAAVVVNDAVPRPNEGELIEFCTNRIARYKRPRRILFVDELPKSAYGKPLRKEARERFRALV